MSNVIYAVKTYELSAQDLTITEIKLGRTSNIKSTMAQYNRSHRDAEILDLWRPNEKLKTSEVEKGVLNFAEKYAHERSGETFRFLQDGYEKFSDNISSLLVPTTLEKLQQGEEDKSKREESDKKKRDDYTGEKPEFFVLEEDYIEVKNWRDLLGKVAKKIERETEEFEKASEISGRTRDYFSKNPDDLVAESEIPSSDYYFEGNLSATQIMNVVERLVEKFGYDFEEDFKLGLK